MRVACPDGRCILRTWVCDGHADCSNGTDETNCGEIYIVDCQIKTRGSGVGRVGVSCWVGEGDWDGWLEGVCGVRMSY